MKRRLARKEVNNKKLHERTERIKRLREEIIMGKKEQLRKERVLEPNKSEKCLYNTLVGAAEEVAEKI